jgi:hypothetical protein
MIPYMATDKGVKGRVKLLMAELKCTLQPQGTCTEHTCGAHTHIQVQAGLSWHSSHLLTDSSGCCIVIGSAQLQKGHELAHTLNLVEVFLQV